MFPLAKYDPFHLGEGQQSEIHREFQTEVARTLARALRIQTTIVVLDGMVRSDADYHFSAEQLQSLSAIGVNIKKMLKIPLDNEKSNAAAKLLFVQLEEIRRDIHCMSTAVAEDGLDIEREHSLKEFQASLFGDDLGLSMRTEGDDLGRGIPKNATGKEDNTLFFLQLVEHLILRSLRLYQVWKHAEPRSKLIHA